MRRFELYPVDGAVFLVKAQSLQSLGHSSVDRVARVALRHDDKIAIDLILSIDGDPVPCNRLFARDDGNSRGHRPALLFEGLIIELQSGQTRFDTFSN